MAKYFKKLNRQLGAKDRKSKSSIIREFLNSYEEKKSWALIDWKAPQRAEKEVAELRQRVG